MLINVATKDTYITRTTIKNSYPSFESSINESL